MTTRTRRRSHYVCSECGAASPKWVGRCDGCGQWNTIIEDHSVDQPQVVTLDQPAVSIVDLQASDAAAIPTGISELDTVLDGGLVPGSVTLIGGEPGIGKSTLLLQVANQASAAAPVLYLSGEESTQQVYGRAARLGTLNPHLFVASETSIDAGFAHIADVKPTLVIIDSIQTVCDPAIGSPPGSLAQVRQCAQRLVNHAKSHGVSIVLVGQVTKDGNLAGPRALEHLVDTVLTFEGDREQTLRTIRAAKHRFGSTNSVGMFAMTETGLMPIPDPSAMFLAERNVFSQGSIVLPTLDGHRPLLVEVQALTVNTEAQFPKRSASGLDINRLNVLLAVISRLVKGLHKRDVYAVTGGGTRVVEPAADLAIAMAIASDALDISIPCDVVAFGEVGLGTEVRSVNAMPTRIREAERMGFTSAIVPPSALNTETSMRLFSVRHLGEAFNLFKNYGGPGSDLPF